VKGVTIQFYASIGRVFHVIGIVLATYSVRWERGNTTSIASILHSGRFLLSAEQRARRIIKVTREADISLCKGFWNLTEEGLYYVSWKGHVFHDLCTESAHMVRSVASCELHD
jgi:hypothetical protein